MGRYLLENKMKQPSAETALTQVLGSPSLGGCRAAPAWCLTRDSDFSSQAAVLVQDLREPPFCPCSLCPSFVVGCLRLELDVDFSLWLLYSPCTERKGSFPLRPHTLHFSKTPFCCFCEMLDPGS